MATLLIPTPLWATPDGWFSATAETLEQADDDQLVEHYQRLTCVCLVAAGEGVHSVPVAAARRWAEWVIGIRLGDDDTLNVGPAFSQLTDKQLATCRLIGHLDGDVLHDHLRRATCLTEVSRSACLRFVDMEVGA